MPDAVPAHRDAAAWSALAAVTAVHGWRAAPAGNWLDSGEFIAAARTLGGVHPPGHPTWLSLAAWADLLPIGPYAWRVGGFSALCAGIAAFFAVRLARAAAAASPGNGAGAVGLACAALVGSSLQLAQVAVRAEVYTLALATALWSMDAALRCRREAAAGDTAGAAGAAAEAAAAVAVGLGNHHYLCLFTLPAVIVAGWPGLAALRRKAPRFALAGVLVAAGLGLAYLALPLRALADVEMRWGNAASLQGFWDTVSVRQFQRSVSEAHEDVVANAGVLLATIVDGGGYWLPLAGLAGLIVGAVKRAPVAITGAVLLAGGIFGKAIMHVDLHNPDDHGYLLAAVGALAMGLGVVGSWVLRAPLRPALRWGLAAAVAAAAATQLWATGESSACNLQGLRAPESLDSQMRRAVAPGALVLTNYYGLQFNEMAFRLAEGRRPDWIATHQSFRTGDTDHGVAFARWFANRYPELKVLAQAARYLGRPPIGNVLPLVEQQPVYAEADPNNQIPSQYWSFDGIEHRLLADSERVLDYDVEQLRARRARIWRQTYERFSAADMADHSTRMVLLWSHALQACHALRRGWREVARDEIGRARALAPTDRLVGNLANRLGQLDAAWARADTKTFNALWQRFETYDFDALASDTP